MKRFMLKTISLFLVVLLLGGVFAFGAAVPAESVSATILFTHDMHSHFLPSKIEGGGETGGFTRLATVIEQERSSASGAVLTVDGGDFSMGTLFQTAYSEQAGELRALGMMGYDAVTLGNHEFDYRGDGLVKMLNAAMESTDLKKIRESIPISEFNDYANALPTIVLANYKPPQSGEEGYDATAQSVQDAFDDYGVAEYTMIEKDGVRFAVFGLEGEDSDDCAPMSGMVLEPAIDAAKRVVAEIQANEEYDFIICLSHSGIWDKTSQSEDEQLAKAVSGIDVIVSGHTHSTLSEPLIVNDTLIVCSGEYAENLGVLSISRDSSGKLQMDGYELVPIDENVASNEAMELFAQEIKDSIGEGYLKDYGMTFDEVLATTPFAFTPISEFGSKQEDDSLGSLIADSYIYAVQQAEGGDYEQIDFAVVGQGVVRGSFPAGDITVSDAFNVSSLGVGADGTPGYPLLSVYLTGRELRDAFEVDASVTPLMSGAQLYGTGMRYSFNTNRLIFNKVTDYAQVLPDGTEIPLVDDQLYRVVTGLYSGQMLGTVKGKSFGILSITPKDKDGNPIEDLEAQIIHDSSGNEVKEWYALASYLQSLEVVPEQYSSPSGSKTIISSWNPVELLKNPNWITLVVLAVILLLIALIVLIVVRVRRRIRKKRTYVDGK